MVANLILSGVLRGMHFPGRQSPARVVTSLISLSSILLTELAAVIATDR